jgi:ubiquinone/menaquinone biosynthesis C-methylase UbiE
MPRMGWYDFFSRFYDSSLEKLYVDARKAAADALELAPGMTVLDFPCGTGQSFDGIVSRIRPGGRLVGADLSEGMLARAAKRASTRELVEVVTTRGDARSFGAEQLRALGVDRLDRLHVFLGLSAFPDWEASFERLFGLLAPGGRCVVVDVHAEKPSFQGRMVNLVARADITRRTWEPLERLSSGFERRELPSLPQHGGQLFLATGTRRG